MTYFNEDRLVQQTTADYLRDKLGWESVYACNQAAYGHDGLLGRDSDREVVLARYVRQAFKKFNPDLPETANHLIFQTPHFPQSNSPNAPRPMRLAPCSLPSKIPLDFSIKIYYNNSANPIKSHTPFSDETQRLSRWGYIISDS